MLHSVTGVHDLKNVLHYNFYVEWQNPNSLNSFLSQGVMRVSRVWGHSSILPRKPTNLRPRFTSIKMRFVNALLYFSSPYAELSWFHSCYALRIAHSNIGNSSCRGIAEWRIQGVSVIWQHCCANRPIFTRPDANSLTYLLQSFALDSEVHIFEEIIEKLWAIL